MRKKVVSAILCASMVAGMVVIPENNLSAGVAYQGSYKTCVLGFPFESLRTTEEREYLMNAIMTFFDSNTKK